MEIIYEDNHLLVVNKPVNVPVNADSSADSDLQQQLKAYLKEKYDKPGNVYLGLVHRLDRPVGGVMVFARTSKAASRLSESLRKGEFQKTYLAVVEAKAPPEAHLEDWLVKDGAANTTTVTQPGQGKLALLDYRTLQKADGLSLLQVRIGTGRSHQIRVQLSHAGLPIWGDQRYNRHAIKGQQIALFAHQLSFPHPVTRQILTFTARLPKGRPWSDFDTERFDDHE